MYKTFPKDIERMNAMYELTAIGRRITDVPAMLVRLDQFDKILTEECDEITDITTNANALLSSGQTMDLSQLPLSIRVQLADLLGDIVVYCASEALRWNIPLDAVLNIIMASNFSKLGADGKPIKNPETGKFLKGPDYWKPEPMIKQLIERFDISPDAEVKPIDMDYVVAQATKGQEQ